MELSRGTNYSAPQTSDSGSKKGQITIREAHRVLRRVDPESSKYWFGRIDRLVRSPPVLQLAGGYLQIPIFEYRSIYRLVPRSVQCCQLPCYHGRDPLPTCMVLASNQVVRTRALVHAQTWSPMGEVPSALCWSSGTPPPAAGGGGRF